LWNNPKVIVSYLFFFKKKTSANKSKIIHGDRNENPSIQYNSRDNIISRDIKM
jgi:hypothetical protein